MSAATERFLKMTFEAPLIGRANLRLRVTVGRAQHACATLTPFKIGLLLNF